MHKIYEQATKVLVWLGESKDNGDSAMRYIHSLGDKPPSLGDLFDRICEPSTHRIYRDLQTQLSKMNLPLLKTIWNLNLRSWYSRLWVFKRSRTGEGRRYHMRNMQS